MKNVITYNKCLIIGLLCIVLGVGNLHAMIYAQSESENTSNEFFIDETNSDNPLLSKDSCLYLVNKNFTLESDYIPQGLVKPDVPVRKKSIEKYILMRKEAANALEKMFNASKQEEDFDLLAVSGYRSYVIQKINFNGKVKSSGSERIAEETVARPGTSEHQLGLAMDLQCPQFVGLDAEFALTEEGKWLEANSYRFGFILRYPIGGKEITGFNWEAWHYRYIGISHATAVYLLNEPYEMYYKFMCKLPDAIIKNANPFLLAGLVSDMMKNEDATLSMINSYDVLNEVAMKEMTMFYLSEYNMSYEQVLAWMKNPYKLNRKPVIIDNEKSEISLHNILNE